MSHPALCGIPQEEILSGHGVSWLPNPQGQYTREDLFGLAWCILPPEGSGGRPYPQKLRRAPGPSCRLPLNVRPRSADTRWDLFGCRHRLGPSGTPGQARDGGLPPGCVGRGGQEWVLDSDAGTPDLVSDIWLLLLTFFCGAAYECGCVFWVHYSEKNRVPPAVFWSCFNALVTVIGLGEALHRPLFIAAYVLGFGVGTWAALRIKARWFLA